MSYVSQFGNTVRDVNFPEFTASLITGVFEALQNNHMAQIEAYSDLLAKTSQTLSGYIKQNSNDVSGEEVLGLLSETLPIPLEVQSSNDTFASLGEWYDSEKTDGKLKTLKPGSKSNLGVFLQVKDSLGNTVENDSAEMENISTRQELVQAVRYRIAAQRYDVLSQMVRLGMMRLVVDKGEIKTRVTFNVTESKLDTEVVNDLSVKSKSWGVGGGLKLFGGKLNLSGGYRSASTTVRAVNQQTVDMQNINIDLFGSVNIQFKTDYFPLNPNSIQTPEE